MNQKSGAIFYVGRSIMSLRRRLINHLTTKEIFNKGLSGHIVGNEKHISIHEIEECSSNDEKRLEEYWIQQFLCWGFDMVNIRNRPSDYCPYIPQDRLQTIQYSNSELCLLAELSPKSPYSKLAKDGNCSEELIRIYTKRKEVPKWAKELIMPFYIERAKRIADVYFELIK